MTFEEAREELVRIEHNGFVNDKKIRGTDRIISSLRFAIQLIEKRIPKRPTMKEITEGIYQPFCPWCERNYLIKSQKFCENCGQALDWGEAE